MRAAVIDRYGPPEVVEVREIPDPVPDRKEVLVRVRAAAVTSGDARIRAARFPHGFAVPARLAFGLRRPRQPVLGSCFAGLVEQVGSEVRDVRVGDRVCGMAGMRMGAHAELIAVPEMKTVAVPDEVSDDDAAGLLCGGTTARYFVEDRARVRAGMNALVIGGSGAVGSNVVQLALRAGATVTATCSAANADLVTRLGATRVLDRHAVDLAAMTDRFDAVFDTVGVLDRHSGRRLLTEHGVLALVVAGLADTVLARGPVLAGTSRERPEDMRDLLALVAAGELEVIIDQRFALADIVEAHRRVDSGHKVGNLIVHP